ncbi:MAG: glycosyltransferase family 39 protein [Ketobacteraceae bacterium]|nr:glycosyltransferase family 39 protein [Ketobacteraceae bacterium]
MTSSIFSAVIRPFHGMGSTIRNFSTLQDIVFIYCLALIPRLLFVILTGQAELSLDEIEYDRIAWYLSEGEGYRWYFGLECTYRPPVYPAFLAAIYWIAGPDYYIARIVQTFFIATQSVLTYLIGRELFSRKTSLLAGAVVSLYLTLICFSVTLMSENLFISLMLAVVLFFLKLHGGKRFVYVVGAGIFSALAILCRPSAAPLILLFLPWFFWRTANRKQALQQLACFLLIIAVPVTGWIYRNYTVTGEIFFIDSRSGYNLYIGYNERSPGNFHMDSASDMLFQHIDNTINAVAPELSTAQGHRLFRQELRAYKNRTLHSYDQYDLSKAPGDIWFDRWGKQKAFEFITEHPLDALALIPKKFMYFWNLEHRILLFGYSNGVIGEVPTVPLFLLFLLMLSPWVLIVTGSVLYLASHPINTRMVILLTPVVYLMVLHSLTFGGARFHYPIIPILALFASATFWQFRIAGGNGLRLLQKPVNRKRLLVAIIAMTIFTFIWSFGMYESWDKWTAVFGPNGHRRYLGF